MIKDFESEERYLNHIKKIENKWKSENKKYYERLGQMKEKKEEKYNIRRNNLLKEYIKKSKEIELQLYKTRQSKESNRKKQIAIMLKKEEDANMKKRLKIKKDEQERLDYQTQIFSKCKIYNIYNN